MLDKDRNVINKYLQIHHHPLYLAINHHKNHKNQHLSFKNFPFLIDIYKDPAKNKVIMKSTQSGITEWLIVVVIDQTVYQKRNVFYVMPTEKIKNQFVNTRFDMSIQYTPLYQDLVKDAQYDNMSIKQLKEAAIFFAVSNSSTNFISFPAETYVIDEEDECNSDNLEMAPERLAMSADPQTIRVGNPSYPEFGIDFQWNKSDKKHWFLKCNCGNELIPDFFKHIVMQESNDDYTILDPHFDTYGDRDLNLICDKCNKPVNRYGNGRWINEQQSYISGRHINQIFSSRKPLRSITEQFNEALTNEVKMQRFYNGTLGLPYIGRGAQITDEIINECIKDYMLPQKCEYPCLIGIDVGKKLHTIICRLINNTGQYQMQLVFAGELHFEVTKDKIDISELIDLHKRFNIKAGIIDSRPEARLSKMISQNFPKIWRCDYLNENPKDQLDIVNKIYKTDRTSSMDGIKEQMTLCNIILPKDINRIDGFREQLKAPIRVFEEKEGTNGKWVWREGHKADHYYHALNYANIAKKLLLNAA